MGVGKDEVVQSLSNILMSVNQAPRPLREDRIRPGRDSTDNSEVINESIELATPEIKVMRVNKRLEA